jgi:hypothetical protein
MFRPRRFIATSLTPALVRGKSRGRCEVLKTFGLVAQRTNESVANADFDHTAFDDEELYRRIALAEDNVPRFEAAYWTSRPNQKIKVDVCIRHALISSRPTITAI